MAGKHQLKFPKRGEVFLVNFDPTLGAEIRKTRPALIVQNDIANRHSPITIVAAITSKFGHRLYPTEAFITPPEGGLKQESVVLLNQVRSIDRERLIKRLGTVHANTMKRIDRALEISLGLIDI